MAIFHGPNATAKIARLALLKKIFNYYNAWEKCGISYTGLVEFIVNAMVDIKEPYIEWPEI